MRKYLFLTLAFLLAPLTVQGQTAAPRVMLSCGSYGGVLVTSSQACPSDSPIYNSLGYTQAGYKCCFTQAESDKLNADATKIRQNGYTILKTGDPTTPPLLAATRALTTPYVPPAGTPNPNPGGGGTPSPSPGGSTPAPNPGGGATPNPTAGNSVQINFDPPTKYTTVETFLDSVLGFARNIVVILALVFLVIGGLLYITSAGNDKRIGAAKAAVTAALIGLAIVMVAPSFLKELAGVLGWNDLPSQASDALSLTEIATNVLNFLLSIIGILAIIMFLIGAVMYFVSAGDEKRANTGKDIVKYAIIGIIVTFSALVIIKQIAAFF